MQGINRSPLDSPLHVHQKDGTEAVSPAAQYMYVAYNIFRTFRVHQEIDQI